MKGRIRVLFSILMVVALLLSACQKSNPTPTAEPTKAAPATSPVKLVGDLTYSNDFVLETYYVEQGVALADMTGFVKRDQLWEIPVQGQILGYMDTDYESNAATYYIDLPIRPEATMNDVDNNGQTDTGVQIFAVAYWPNLVGTAYSEGDDRSMGWPSYLASVKTDTENQDEVIGGKLVIWSPDALQKFPTGFGADGLLFTKDDPTDVVPAGWSVIDLDKTPFAVITDEVPSLTLYEPADVAIKDYSTLSYSEAFKKMFDVLKNEYAFNGIAGKQPDWDALWATLEPKVAEAEAKKDAKAYYLALREFTWAFHDGHVGLTGGDMENEVFNEVTAGGYGMSARMLDDGTYMVTFVTPGGAAEKAGIKPGDTIIKINGEAVAVALTKVQPLSAPFSTDFAQEYQQERYLLRAPAGTSAEFTWLNEKNAEKTAKLTVTDERDSFSFSSIYKGFDYVAPPVTYKILDSGVGYVAITSNYDDLGLIIRLFERALKTFEANEVPGIIIDMRMNSGGSPLGLAGFLIDKEIMMGQLEYYSSTTGKFEPEGVRERFYPNENLYKFDKMALLVGQACASACEIEAYGFSQVPGMQVVGYYPSGGIEAEVARGQFLLPEGMSAQFPTGRFTMEDGSLFLEGAGVPLDIRVPKTRENLLSTEDVELKTAEQYVLLPLGAGIVPAKNPIIAVSDAKDLLYGGETLALEDSAQETYSNSEMAAMNKTFTYTVPLKKQPVLWMWGWCSADDKTLAQNMQNIQLEFTLNGTLLENATQFKQESYQSGGMSCKLIYTALSGWPSGEHHLTTKVIFKTAINDGTTVYPAGYQQFDYTVYVAPR